MSRETATALWSHFRSVIDRTTAEMKGVDWGLLYPLMRDESLDPDALEAEVKALMERDDVKRSGIYR